MNIFTKELPRKELFDHLKESMESTNMLKQTSVMRLYYMAKEESSRQEKKRKIIDKLSERSQRLVTEIFLIDEKSAIIQTNEALFGHEARNWYRIYYNNNIYSECTDNFDHALIMLICARQDELVNSDAARLIARMLKIDLPK